LGAGGIAGPARFKGWVDAPLAVVTVAVKMRWLPGHQAKDRMIQRNPVAPGADMDRTAFGLPLANTVTV
jgi:hypothetical protein